jgi:ferredoxin
MGMTLAVDLEKCQGYACCLMIAPTIFNLDDSGKALLLQSVVPDSLKGKAADAARACPTQAITVERS